MVRVVSADCVPGRRGARWSSAGGDDARDGTAAGAANAEGVLTGPVTASVEISDGGGPSDGGVGDGKSERSIAAVVSSGASDDGGAHVAGSVSNAGRSAVTAAWSSNNIDFLRRAGSGGVTGPLDRRGLARGAHRRWANSF